MKNLNLLPNLANPNHRWQRGFATACAVAAAAAISIGCQSAQSAPQVQASIPTLNLASIAVPESAFAQAANDAVVNGPILAQATDGTNQQDAPQDAPVDPAMAAMAEALKQALLESQANSSGGTQTGAADVDLSNVNVDLNGLQQMMMQQMTQLNMQQDTSSPTNR
jgi:hypothetical protein